MKSSLALFAEPVLAGARRLFWLSLWLLWVPMGLYIVWLRQGHTLVWLKLALLGVAVIGLTVINAETAAVFFRHCLGRPGNQRGILQRWFIPWKYPAGLPQPGVATLTETAPIPFVSVIVVAYLPNEQDIIEETLLHWLTQVDMPSTGWEVILAYNTPAQLPVEARLYQLAHQHSALVLLPVSQSRSKAENLNAALRHVRGEMTCIFDADHHPTPDCLSLAWEWLNRSQYDGVQGRNIIRNAADNWMTQLIAVEFECIYGISHYGRSILADTALFGGSNGYWRTEAIRNLGFTPTA
ncbi:MAG: glycosyltransferase family 2 protein [Leptolyngbyaceae cyanobacterium SM2_5_2]|nr:glycosyltransferase family 2 protein [Leptolyngbyaceae cyanobacterium SM2_5_2]